MALDIAKLQAGLNELQGFVANKAATAEALGAATANQTATAAANALTQKAADDAAAAAKIADGIAQQRIADEVNWLISELKEDANAGPDPGAPNTPPPVPSSPPIVVPIPSPDVAVPVKPTK